MQIAYGNGKGTVFEGLLNWLDSPDDDLQVTAVLCMANFARTGEFKFAFHPFCKLLSSSY